MMETFEASLSPTGYDTRGGVLRLTGGKRTTLLSSFLSGAFGSAAFRLHPVHSRTSSSVIFDSIVKSVSVFVFAARQS